MPGTGRKSIAQDCMQVLQIFVSETCKNLSQEYLVSESRGASLVYSVGIQTHDLHNMNLIP